MFASGTILRPSRRELIRMGLFGSVAAPVARAENLARRLIVRSARPQDLETPVTAFTEELTPTDIFLVRSHFGPPIIDLATWRLRVEGMVDRPLELSMAELRKMGRAKRPAVLQCAGNGRALFRPRVAGAQWQRGGVGQALWQGVRLGELLDRCRVQPSAQFVTFIPGDHPMAPPLRSFSARFRSRRLAWMSCAEGELCLSCHSAELIATSRIALAGWTAEITKMRNWGALVDEDKAAPLAAWFAQKYPLAEREPSAAMISAADAIAAVTPEHEKPPARGDPQAGASLYAKDCASCHGPHAEGLGGGPVLIDAPAIYQRSRFSELVLKGKGRMPAAQGIGEREIGDLLVFLRQLH